jgi:hypothetical protein
VPPIRLSSTFVRQITSPGSVSRDDLSSLGQPATALAVHFSASAMRTYERFPAASLSRSSSSDFVHSRLRFYRISLAPAVGVAPAAGPVAAFETARLSRRFRLAL